MPFWIVCLSRCLWPGRCAVLRAPASKWNRHSWSLPTTIVPIEWRVDAKKTIRNRQSQSHSFAWQRSTARCEKREDTSRSWMGNPPASSVLTGLGTVWLPSLPVNATRTYGHTLLQLRTSPKMGGWMDCLERHRVHTVVGLPERWEKIVETGGNHFDLGIRSSSLRNKSILETKRTAGIKFTAY